MKRPLILLALIPLTLWGLFALPEILSSNPTFWDWRRILTVLSGLLALWWMSAGMVLATRPVWLEQRFGGLDKLYRLHKYLGIGSGTLVLTHWMIEWLPKKLAKLGWIPPRPRGPKGMQDWWLSLAKDVGEWAGYILLALVVIALVRRIPYRYFRLVHKAFGAVFLAVVFHGLMMLPDSFWGQPLGWLTAAMALAGIIPALLSLSNRIGRQRQFPAVVERILRHDSQVLELVCRPQATWPGHRAGQFLFADFGQKAEGAHPFTIASDWNPRQGTLTLAIKALGDFTATLASRLQVGSLLRLEGPYGNFDFLAKKAVDRNNPPENQVWIAGGIGVTPFLARLGTQAANGQAPGETDFFYCTPTASNYPEHLAARCQAAGVHLHRRLTDRDGPLSTAEIAACIKSNTSVWFCGPAAWGDALAKALHEQGLPRSAFHREAFEFR